MYPNTKEDFLSRLNTVYPNATQEKVDEFERCVRDVSLLRFIGAPILGSTIIHIVLPKSLGLLRPIITLMSGISILFHQRIQRYQMCAYNTFGPPNVPAIPVPERTYPPVTYNADSIDEQGSPSQDFPSADYLIDDKPSWSNSDTGFNNNTNVFDDTSNQFETDATDAIDKKVRTEKKRITYDDLYRQSYYNNESRRHPIVRPSNRSNVGVTPSHKQDSVFEDTKLPEEKEYIWS